MPKRSLHLSTAGGVGGTGAGAGCGKAMPTLTGVRGVGRGALPAGAGGAPGREKPVGRRGDLSEASIGDEVIQGECMGSEVIFDAHGVIFGKKRVMRDFTEMRNTSTILPRAPG